MAIRHVDGFDDYATADLTGIYQSVGAFTTIQSTTKRTGASALRTQSGNLDALILTNPGTATAGGIMGFAYRVEALAAEELCGFVDNGTIQVAVYTRADGKLEVRRGINGTVLATSTNALLANTWYWIEFKATINDTTGVIELRVNGSSTGWIPSTGSLDTQVTANASFTQWAISTGSIGYFDDLYFADGSSDFKGDSKVVTVIASAGDGALAEWTPSSGTDNGAMVDEATPNGDTDYNLSSTLNQKDSYAFAALGVAGTIHALQVNNWVKKTDAGSRGIKGLARISATNYLGTELMLGTTYVQAKEVWETSPASAAAWTVSEIDGAEFGLQLTT